MPGEEISRWYSRLIGSATSIAGETLRESRSQSSTAIVPSGRSAMICTVMPFSPDTFTRTSS